MADDALRQRCAAAVAGHYEIEAEVGRGGMAVVYRARDVRLRRKVALKVLPPELAFRDEVKRRFLREAEMAAGLAHPHIVPIYTVDENDGLVWMAMGLVDGESLAERLHGEPRPPVDVVRRVLREVCEALAYAHREGVVHRDIKPDNLLIERETGRVLVTDFGIARAAEGDQRLTATGIAVGTPAYMSPEQAMGEREVDGRADLYALGVVGYQMLAGELPFQAANTPTMLMKHLSERPRPLRDVRADLPDNLIYAIDRALTKGRDDRWRTADEFRAALAEDAEPPSVRRRSTGASQAVVGRPSTGAAASGASEPLPAADPLDDLKARTPVPGPEFPKLPPDWIADPEKRDEGAEALRRWREEARRWREQVRHQPRAQREDLRVAAQRMSAFELQQKTPEQRITAVRRRMAAGVVTVGMLALINAIVTPGFPWVLFPAIGIGFGVVKRLADLWSDGIPIRAVFRKARPAAVRGDESPLRRLEPKLPAPPAATAAQAVLDAVPADVLASAQGQAVRDAFSARSKIRGVLARLPEEERTLLPEIEPTVDALVERVRTLAIALHALDTEANPDAMVRLETRIAQAEQMPEGPERERRLELLQRQRATLIDLAERRGSLAAQLEQAVLVLETMQLDLAKLRSSGMASRVADQGPLTEEMRAIARDIERVAEAVDESRLDRRPGK
ncbi:MAG: protein kinase [Gemmatimonadaceae bacterium]|nr:protein kinase [Gemmatimonadaceae bacterium]MCW5827533.1 protein kinase [Gemmatimonadaceae bacterium]